MLIIWKLPKSSIGYTK